MSLTKRLVKPTGRGRTHKSVRKPRTRVGRAGADRPGETAASLDGSRARLFSAAAALFAAKGFAGARVDRVAADARVNKAMVYYHFGSKAGLYREILHDMFQAVCRRAQDVAASAEEPRRKIQRFVEAIAIEAEARPYIPAIWFREVAEGGTHLDAVILRDMSGVVQALTAIIEQGVADGRFRRTHPLLVHAGIVAPLMMFLASAPLRARLSEAGMADALSFDSSQVVSHVQRVTLGVLEGRM